MTEQVNQEEIDAFNAELQPLLDKYGFALGAEAFIQDGNVLSRPVVSFKPKAEKTGESV